MINKCAVILVRVSTKIQEYEPQLDDLKKYAKSKGYTKIHMIETKESGLVDLDNKVGTNQLFSFIEKNPQYNVVFTTEISRLGRRQSVLHQIKEWFIKNEVQLFVKDVGYSLLDENGKVTIAGEMMFSLYGLFAEAEIKQKKDRFRRAKESLMEIGYSISGRTLFGYERIEGDGKKNTLKLHPENSNIVRTIFNWYINGINIYEKKVSIKQIVLESRKRGFHKYTHSKRNVNKLLKEEGYTGGKITNNKRKNINYKEGSKEEKYFVTNNKIKYPVIIDKETFELTQKRLKENNSKIDKSTKNITILSKLIKCNQCNNHYGGNYRIVEGRNLDTYRCSSRSGVNYCKNTQSISMSMLDSTIWSLIKTDLYTLSKIISKYNPDKNISQFKKSLSLLEGRITEIDEEISILNQSILNFKSLKNISTKNFFDTLQSKLSKLDKERGGIENEISKIKINLLTKEIDISNPFESIKTNLELIDKSKDLLKKYINLFVEKIEIILHNSSYSIIKVTFKINSRYEVDVSNIKLPPGVEFDFPIESTTYVILDKRQSQKIKSYKSNLTIKTTNKEDKIIITSSEKSKKLINVNLNELQSTQNKSYFDRFMIYKLNVY